ncbi:MAG TPA: 50S ribosomal protein L29 [Pyrinomonadaceae bacterium]|jgi:large subunit ribosomal protein L29|nr:50S ribosomal protein L29 [Pyrinomonadaceae bacterium]
MKRREELDKYRDLSKDELKAEAARLKESLFRLNFKLALGEVDAVKRIRQEKKSLARIKTLVGQQEAKAS